MYDVIETIINHVWDADSLTNEQQFIFCISGAMIIILTVWVLDAISAFIINLNRKGGRS